MKKTLIIGATPNSSRYAHLAAVKLVDSGHEIINLGIKNGEVAGVVIQKIGTPYPDIDTITLYIGKPHQAEYYDYILKTNPKRLIFNPGSENEELATLARDAGIEVMEACTLVLLSTKQY